MKHNKWWTVALVLSAIAGALVFLFSRPDTATIPTDVNESTVNNDINAFRQSIIDGVSRAYQEGSIEFTSENYASIELLSYELAQDKNCAAVMDIRNQLTERPEQFSFTQISGQHLSTITCFRMAMDRAEFDKASQAYVAYLDSIQTEEARTIRDAFQESNFFEPAVGGDDRL